MAKIYNRFHSQSTARTATPPLAEGTVQVTPSDELRKGFDVNGVCVAVRTGPPLNSNSKFDQVMKIHFTLEEVRMIADIAAIVKEKTHLGAC